MRQGACVGGSLHGFRFYLFYPTHTRQAFSPDWIAASIDRSLGGPFSPPHIQHPSHMSMGLDFTSLQVGSTQSQCLTLPGAQGRMGQWETRLFPSLEASRKNYPSSPWLVEQRACKHASLSAARAINLCQSVAVGNTRTKNNLGEQRVYFSLHVTDYSPSFTEARGGARSRDPGKENWSRDQGGVPVCWLPQLPFPYSLEMPPPTVG